MGLESPFYYLDSAGWRVALYTNQDEGVSNLSANQERWHDFGPAPEGGVYSMVQLEASPDFPVRSDGGPGRCLVHGSILRLVLFANHLEG